MSVHSISQMIPLAGIEIAANVRTKSGLDSASIKELAESLKAHGLLQPIYVAKAGDSYAVIAGQRRTLAAIEAGWTEIAAIVSEDETGEERKAKQIVENLHRENLSLAETCAAVRDMLAMVGKPGAVAERLNKSSAWVSKHLSITGPNFTPEVRELVNDGQCHDVEMALTLHQIAKHPECSSSLAAQLIAQVRAGLIGRARLRAELERLKTPGEGGDDGEGEDGEGDGGGEANPTGKQTITADLSAELAAVYEALGGATWLRKTLKKAAEAQAALPI